MQFLSRLTLMFDKSRGKDQHVDITMKRCKSIHDHMCSECAEIGHRVWMKCSSTKWKMHTTFAEPQVCHYGYALFRRR